MPFLAHVREKKIWDRLPYFAKLIIIINYYNFYQYFVDFKQEKFVKKLVSYLFV